MSTFEENIQASRQLADAHALSMNSKPMTYSRQKMVSILCRRSEAQWRSEDISYIKPGATKMIRNNKPSADFDRLAKEYKANAPHPADEATLARREKEIRKAKEKTVYKQYIQKVPLETREKSMPQTPKKEGLYSRRNWDSIMRQWKLDLYIWQKNSLNEDTENISNNERILIGLNDDENVEPSYLDRSFRPGDSSGVSSEGKSFSSSPRSFEEDAEDKENFSNSNVDGTNIKTDPITEENIEEDTGIKQDKTSDVVENSDESPAVVEEEQDETSTVVKNLDESPADVEEKQDEILAVVENNVQSPTVAVMQNETSVDMENKYVVEITQDHGQTNQEKIIIQTETEEVSTEAKLEKAESAKEKDEKDIQTNTEVKDVSTSDETNVNLNEDVIIDEAKTEELINAVESMTLKNTISDKPTEKSNPATPNSSKTRPAQQNNQTCSVM